MRVAHRNAPDYGIYGLLKLLANFWQNGFLMTSPLEGESENRRVYIGDLNGGPGWTSTTDLALISTEVPGLGVSFFAIPDPVRLDNPKLMLGENCSNAGTRRFKRATSVGLSWDLERRPRFPDGILEGMLGHSRSLGHVWWLESKCRVCDQF